MSLLALGARGRAITIGGALLGAALVFSAVDAVFIMRIAGPLAEQLLHVAYVLGHRAFLALAVLLLVAAGRLATAPRPRVLAPLATFAVGTVGLFFLLEGDLASFSTAIRLAGAAAFAAVAAIAVAVHAWRGDHWLVRAGSALVAVGLTIANHHLLQLSYPGFHVICLAYAQLFGAIAIVGLEWLPPRPRPLSWARDAVLSLVAAWSVVIPPSNNVAVRLANDDAAPGYRFAATFYRDVDDGVATFDKRNPYFLPRKRAKAVAPGAPVVPRDDLLVLMVTVDALRYDVAAGERGGNLPTMTELRESGFFFEQAYAGATSTSATMSGIFSGRYFSQLEWENVNVGGKYTYLPVPSDKLRFPALLTKAGVDTFALPTHWRVSAAGRMALGFSKEYKSGEDEKLRASGNAREADEVLPAMLAWAKAPRSGRGFAFCHLMDAHAPYNRGGKDGDSFTRYLHEIELIDAELGKLIAGLKEAGLWEKTVFILSADHGESFGEHGQNAHHGWGYQEQLHVPFIVRVPGKQGARVSEPITLLDIGPTLLDMFGTDTPGTFMGQSLAPILRGEQPRFQRPVAYHTSGRQFGFIFPDGIKTMYASDKKRREVYDLKADPKEEHNLADEPWAADRLATAREFFRVHNFRKKGYRVPNNP